MDYRATRYALFAFPFFVMCQPVQASTWQICRMELHITDALKLPYPKLQAQVVKVSQASTTAECPEKGATITFVPETADYQSTLPRRQWPKKGQLMHINYRYLDGTCKGDGHPHECRIEHYPLAGSW